jgi:carbonic anhydrase
MGLVQSCGKNDHASQPNKSSQGAKTAKEWGYEEHNGPDTWFDKYEAAQGKRQSPIDLQISNGGAQPEPMPEDNFSMVKVSYNTTDCEVVNNGHTVQWNPQNGGFVTVKDRRFDLLQFHFHIPSEHTFNNEPKALEIHFVHQEKSSGTLLVLGHLFHFGDYNNFIHDICNCSPPQEGEKFQLKAIDLSTLPGLDGAYIHYQGSLTTPPCSEGVQWYVNKKLANISHSQVAWFKQSIPFENARPIQKYHGRKLEVNYVARCSHHHE